MGEPVVGYGFTSNGRYAQGGILRERFIPRIMAADARSLVDAEADNLDPLAVWKAFMANEKPGGHGDRAHAAGGLDMARVGRGGQDRGQTAVAPAGRALQRRTLRRARAGLSRRRLLLPRQGDRRPEGRDARLPGAGLSHRQDEDRRRRPRHRHQAHRGRPRRGRHGREPRRRCQRPVRSRDRACLRQGHAALRPVLVRGAGRSARLPAQCGARRALCRARWRRARTCSR